MFADGEHPILYALPATAWNNTEKSVFVFHAYEGKKSDAEYGLNLSKKNIPEIENYKIENIIDSIQ